MPKIKVRFFFEPRFWKKPWGVQACRVVQPVALRGNWTSIWIYAGPMSIRVGR